MSWPRIVKALLTFRDPQFYLFFPSSAAGKRAARAFLARLKERQKDRDQAVPLKAFLRQLKAIKAWGRQAPQPLDAIRKPVLVANGDRDIMVPSENSSDMARRISGAELVLYPGAGHGGIFQYHDEGQDLPGRLIGQPRIGGSRCPFRSESLGRGQSV